MKILFLPNWSVVNSNTDIADLQAPDKYIKGKPYWFFNFFSEDTYVDIIDIQAHSRLHGIEKKKNSIYCKLLWHLKKLGSTM